MTGTGRLQYLFDRYFTHSSTPEEDAEFSRLVAESDPQTLLRLLGEKWETFKGSETVLETKETTAILRDILNSEQQFNGDGKIVSIYKAVRRWWLYAAVIVLIMVPAAIFLSDKNHEKQQLPVTITTTDLKPGQNGAVLTLATGEKILLDSAGNGLLAKQGNVQILNKQGELSYHGKNMFNDKEMYNTMSTPKGRQYRLQLSDGSKVWLNAASSITYPPVFDKSSRRVSVMGEAYFEIAHDAKSPFIVSIEGKGEVEVLGTKFNINAYDDEPFVNTTVLQGSVKVTASDKRNHLTLLPNQQAQMGSMLTLNENINIEKVMAWKNGFFSFNGENTEAIMRQVKRWYDAEIVYEGNVKDERFVGTVARSSYASKLLEVLELTKTVKFTIDGKRIVVKPYE